MNPKIKIVPKRETIPSFDPNAVAANYIEYYHSPKKAYKQEEITPKIISKIIKEVSQAVNKPVTVKIRKGFDDNSINATEFAKMA